MVPRIARQCLKANVTVGAWRELSQKLQDIVFCRRRYSARLTLDNRQKLVVGLYKRAALDSRQSADCVFEWQWK